MGSRGGLRSSALDRAKALLSGQRISNTARSADKRDVENSTKLKSLTRPDLSDIPASPRENQDPAKSFIIGGGSRFLKKSSKNATEDRQSFAPSGTPAEMDDFKSIPQRGSQSTALSRLALIESRIRHQKSEHTHLSEAQETRLSVQSSSDLSTTGTRFLKKTLSAPQEEKAPERAPGLNEYKGRRVSLDSDEQDMRRLLGDSFSLSESSLQNAVRKTSPQPVKKLYKKSSESSPTPERHKVVQHKSPSTSPSRPESRLIRFTERSVFSESDHSEIRSLDDLFPVDSDDTLSERSTVLDDFKLNVMTLEDLAPIPFAAAEISQEKKKTPARKEDKNKKSSNDISKLASPPTPDEASAAYESDFESEIPSETPSSASEISERLTDEAKDASLVSSYKSQVDDNDDDRTLSQSSPSSSRHSDSSSRSSSSNATVTPSPGRHVKEVAVQTQMDGFAYTWSSGRFQFLWGVPQGYS
ncbi:hypothetical protein F2P79_013771 [Pimephales promelas]|nr:hypothetical protein F2P79_013771 [Pimephales promelas]